MVSQISICGKSDDDNSSSNTLEKVVPHKYSIAGGIDGEDLIRLIEKVRNFLCYQVSS
ncbi:hypothetical protein Gotur_004840 [Gossypium turneri]